MQENDPARAYESFGDDGPRGANAFIEDLNNALDDILSGKQEPPHSYATLKRCLRQGRLFAIITARGHAPSTIERGVRTFIERALTEAERAKMYNSLRKFRCVFDDVCGETESEEKLLDDYFKLCHFRGVTYPPYMKKHGLDKLDPRRAPEEGKKIAIHEFTHSCVEQLTALGKTDIQISVGFSDDDATNVRVAEEFLSTELSDEFPELKFVVYDTSDALKVSKKVILSPEKASIKKRRIECEKTKSNGSKEAENTP